MNFLSWRRQAKLLHIGVARDATMILTATYDGNQRCLMDIGPGGFPFAIG
jgi:hypothetical protein